ncbi:MAG: ANTAR domain-containing protein [Clostridia bacterium]|nr:ANTAR domain-containing protein [Clostridia bacterium]
MTEKNAYSVLIISASEEMRRRIRSQLDRDLFPTSANARNTEESRRLLLCNSYDLVIIDSPIPSAVCHELALDISDRGGSEVILLTDSDSYDQIRYRVERSGVITLPKPIEGDMIRIAINTAMASHSRMLLIEEENRRLRFKNEELRLCNRAKWALHQGLGMDEPTAHRYIEKRAMDNRMTRYAVAKEILKEYEG